MAIKTDLQDFQFYKTNLQSGFMIARLSGFK